MQVTHNCTKFWKTYEANMKYETSHSFHISRQSYFMFFFVYLGGLDSESMDSRDNCSNSAPITQVKWKPPHQCDDSSLELDGDEILAQKIMLTININKWYEASFCWGGRRHTQSWKPNSRKFQSKGDEIPQPGPRRSTTTRTLRCKENHVDKCYEAISDEKAGATPKVWNQTWQNN